MMFRKLYILVLCLGCGFAALAGSRIVELKPMVCSWNNQKKYSLEVKDGSVLFSCEKTERDGKNYSGFYVKCTPFQLNDNVLQFEARSDFPRDTESVFVRCLDKKNRVVGCWYGWRPLKKKFTRYLAIPGHDRKFRWMPDSIKVPVSTPVEKIEFLLQTKGKNRKLGICVRALAVKKQRTIKKMNLKLAEKAKLLLDVSILERINLLAYSNSGLRFVKDYKPVKNCTLGKAETLFAQKKYEQCRQYLNKKYLAGKTDSRLRDRAWLLFADSLLAEKKYRQAAEAYANLDGCVIPEIKVQAMLNRICAQNLLRHFYDAYQTAKKLKNLPEAQNDPRIKRLGMLNIGYIMFYHLNDYFHSTRNCSLLLRETDLPLMFKKICNNIFKDMKVKRNSRSVIPRGRAIALEVAARISKKHPRMFFNAKTWPRILANLKRPIIQQYYLENIKEPAVSAPDKPKVWNGKTGLGKTKDGTRKYLPKPDCWGLMAAKCAFVYLVEKDPEMLKKAVNMLEITGPALLEGLAKGVTADNYYSTRALYAFCAYDWLYNYLNDEQRAKIIKPLLEYVNKLEYDFVKIFCARSYPYSGGFYGVRMLLWYAGLAALHDGIDDELALKFIYEGWLDHQILLETRDVMCGDDGGMYTTTNTYAMLAYIWSSFNFLHTWASATGENLAGKAKHLQYFPQWCAWNVINGHECVIGEGQSWEFKTNKLDFGNGDISNLTKNIPNIDMHMHEIMHFLPENKRMKTIAESLCQHESPLVDSYMRRYRPFIPLFLYNSVYRKNKEQKPPQLKEHARLFENIGIAFMRSGSTPQDTYACFVTNKRDVAHRHYDANNFMIYKYDFLALDTGTRIGYMWEDYAHMNCYYAQTVAHNCILIHMPKEKIAQHWVRPKKPLDIYSHGGQNTPVGDKCIAFENNELFTYIAGDALPVYSWKKCREAIRQFVFVYPDYFVIADRVTSTKKDYRKEWLLHTQNKIVFSDKKTWYSDNGNGRMFCRTLLPEQSKIKVAGGPGHRFEASGRNWELPAAAAKHLKNINYFGQYRAEVSPLTANKKDLFLHVIQVGKNTLPRMVETRLVNTPDTFGVEFDSPKGKWQVTFNRKSNAGGKIRLEKDGKVIYDKTLSEKVQKQSGIIL